jgi:hypothetical protein
MRRAYAVAQQRAARAVTAWAVESDALERTDDIGAVYDALLKGKPDPSKTLHAGIGGNVKLSDTVGELMAASEDAGYLYGLAVGLALCHGGTR